MTMPRINGHFKTNVEMHLMYENTRQNWLQWHVKLVIELQTFNDNADIYKLVDTRYTYKNSTKTGG